MKKPEAEKFIEEYNKLDPDSKVSEKARELAEIYGCTPRTIRNWIELFIKNTEILMGEIEDDGRDFFDYMKDYRPEEPKEMILEGKMKLKDSCLVICMSDVHFGSKYLTKNKRSRLVEDTKSLLDTDNLYAIFVGDMIDWGPAGPRSLKNAQQFSYPEQKKIAMKWGEVVAHKMLALTSGCHSHFSGTGERIEEDFAKEFNRIFLNDGGVLTLMVGDQEYKIFMSHKLRGGSKLNPQRSLMKVHETDMDFDIGVEAHKHTCNTNVSIRRQKYVTTINCGSYKALDDFANKSGYLPSIHSIPGFYLDAKKKIIIPFADWRQGLMLIDDTLRQPSVNKKWSIESS